MMGGKERSENNDRARSAREVLGHKEIFGNLNLSELRCFQRKKINYMSPFFPCPHFFMSTLSRKRARNRNLQLHVPIFYVPIFSGVYKIICP